MMFRFVNKSEMDGFNYAESENNFELLRVNIDEIFCGIDSSQHIVSKQNIF